MTQPVLELRDVHKSFGNTEIIRGADLAVPQGERYAIIGPNGAGKSTLFHLISGKLPLSSGEILLRGERIDGLSAQQIHRKGLTRSFQVTNLFQNMTVYDNLLCAVMWSRGYRYTFWRRRSTLKPPHEHAQEALELIGLQKRIDARVGMITHAEQRALQLGAHLSHR